MKIEPRSIEAYLRSADPRPSIALLYGPDNGLVAERAARLCRGVVADLTDPFRVSDLAADQLAKAPARLAEEAQSLCLMGGRRVVRLRGAGEGCRAALAALLEIERPGALVVIEADDLAASSKLRQLAEKSPSIAVIACYRETGARQEDALRSLLREAGLQLAPDAVAYLASHLGADRAVSRREIEKLALFQGDAKRPMTLDEVASLVGDASALAVDDLVAAVLTGDSTGTPELLARLFAAGEAPVRLLRAVAQLVMTLYRLRLRVEGGEAPDAAVASLRPPPYFKTREQLVRLLPRHPATRLAGWRETLLDAEIRCKTARSPDRLLCAHALSAIALEAGRSSAAAPANGTGPRRDRGGA